MRRSIAALALAVVLPAGALVAPAARADVVVKPGETLSEIAERNGVSLERLMQANGIRNPNMVVAGTRLVLPGSRSGGGVSSGGTVTVRAGETLSEIADRNGVSLNRLMQANGISDPAFVEAGRRLVIPGRRSAAVAATTPARPTGYYTVQSGETLSEIADRNNTTVDRLMQLNGISNPHLVVAGTRLSVPMRSRPAVAQANPARGKAQQHVVKEGETLSHISDDYNVPVERLIALNKISDPNLVVAGTRLVLQAPPPVKAKAKAVAVASKPKPAAAAVARKPAAPAIAKAAPTVTPAKPASQAITTAASPTPQPAKPVTAQAAQPSAAAQVDTATTSPIKATPVSVQPVTKTPAPATQVATTTQSKPVSTAAATTTTTAPAATVATAKTTPQPAAQASPAAAVTPRRNSKAASSTLASAKAVGPDWRSYGPMQVDWANWRAMGGSFVAPSLSSDGKPHYLAINCGARKLNATSQSGQWRTWDSPQNDEEQRLVSDLCNTKGG